MFVTRTWTKTKKKGIYTYKYKYYGLFLFGILPILIQRVTVNTEL